MNDNDDILVFGSLPSLPPPTPWGIVAYTVDGKVARGVLDWSTGELVWSEPQAVAVGTVISGGYDFYADAVSMLNWRWNGEAWEATDDER